jgi:hypothetical protein
MGGYTANRLRDSGKYPGVNFDALGATKSGADPRFPGVHHLDLPRAMADRSEAEKAGHDRASLASAESSVKALTTSKDDALRPGELSAKAEASKAEAMKHTVEGKGSIDVHVRAPKGTEVKAKSSGMFQKTSLNRSFAGERSQEALHPAER